MRATATSVPFDVMMLTLRCGARLVSRYARPQPCECRTELDIAGIEKVVSTTTPVDRNSAMPAKSLSTNAARPVTGTVTSRGTSTVTAGARRALQREQVARRARCSRSRPYRCSPSTRSASA